MTVARKKTTAVKKQRKLPLDTATHPSLFQRNPDSVPSQLEALDVDESFARGRRIAMDDFAQDAAKEWFDKTTRVLSMQVARTKGANPKREYKVERTQGIAATEPYLLCAILVTRIA